MKLLKKDWSDHIGIAMVAILLSACGGGSAGDEAKVRWVAHP